MKPPENGILSVNGAAAAEASRFWGRVDPKVKLAKKDQKVFLEDISDEPGICFNNLRS